MTQIRTELRRDLPPAVLDKLTDTNRDQLAALLSDQRPMNRALVAWADSELVGLAVFGIDDNDMVTVYFARSFLTGLGPPALRGFLAAAQFAGKGFRVHAEKVAVYARSLGLDLDQWTEGADTDGVPMLHLGQGHGQQI